MRAAAVALRASSGSDELINKLVEEFVSKAVASGLEVADKASASGSAALATFIATGGVERDLLEAAEGSRHVLLVYHGLANSQPAALEASAALSDIGVDHLLVDLDSPELPRYMRQLARAASAADRLRSLRLVRFGGPARWLVHSSRWDSELARQLSSSLDERPLEELVRAAEAVSDEDVRREAESRGLRGPQGLERALRLYTAMRRLSGGDPVTVNCFELLRLYGVTPCLALSLLNSDGIVAGCEGDLPSLATMYMLSSLSGRPAWMGNVMRGPGGTLAMAHCTFPISEASSYELLSHYETGMPLAVSARLREGPVATIAKYEPSRSVVRAIRARVALGEPFTQHACRTQALFEVSREALEATFREPMGAHYAVVLDDVMYGLRVLASLLGLRYEEL